MNVSDVIHGRMSTADVRRADGECFPNNLPAKPEVSVRWRSDETLLAIGDRSWIVQGVGRADSECLRELARRGMPTIAWVVQRSPEQVLVQFHEFSRSLDFQQTMEIGVDDRVVDDIRQRLRRQVSMAGAVDWLTRCMLLPQREPDASPRVLLSGSPAPTATHRTAFRLYGSGFAIDVRCVDDDRLLINRVVESRRRMEGDDSRPIYLVEGDIRFCDASTAAQFRGVAQTELDQIVAQSDSYLARWQAYNDKEQQVILKKARDFGWVSYSERKPTPDGTWWFKIGSDSDMESLWPRLDALDERLEAGVEVPSAIQLEEATVLDSTRSRPFVGELSAREQLPPKICVRPPADDQENRTPPEQGFLYVAVGGDEVRIKRRREAWEKVQTARSPMPQLGLILEDQPVPVRRSRKREPITPAVRDVLDSPSDRQRNALDVALNTPDIALIQGPPGTGKTRVIAALQARLAQHDEAVGDKGLAGNTLLTSYQHDAVENAAAATRVMGLPAVKVGYRAGAVEARDGVEAWAVETAAAVRAARGADRPESSVHRALRKVQDIGLAFIRAPAERETPVEILRRVSEVARAWLPGELSNELAHLVDALSAPAEASLGEEDRAAARKAVHGLRIDAAAFADDGPRNAYMTLRRLRRLEGFQMADAEAAALNRAGSLRPDEVVTEGLLKELRITRDGLLDRLQRPDSGVVNLAHGDTEDMIVRIVDALTVRAKETAPGVDIALDEWLTTLDQDPDGTRQAVGHYSMVLAATCQQAVSRPMADAKHGADTVFRTVIVDEAARCNPLDLLIPMSLAERRIILVGDHRQLPHLLEPDIERELEQDVQKETRDALHLSLFEKLFIELRGRERRDGVVRTVTLDQQYRMHPLLGAFVSEQFYEPHGEGFESGRSAEEFAHDVSLGEGGRGRKLTSLAGKVATWIDIPHRLGRECSGRSKYREVEASRVAEEACTVVRQQSDLSVGVITFYVAQRNAILSSMLGQGMTEPDEVEGLRIRDEWRQTASGRERLRVGTVDSFQGKEFDVVFLSLTRSNDIRGDSDAAKRRRYGFLMLENRLCVAMSRQQRLLVVVGDPAMAAGPQAESTVPALRAFRKLCEGPNGSVVRT